MRDAYLDTFSFQAPGFYKKLGYRVFGELGCLLAFVNSEEEGPHRFYHSVGFDEHDVLRAWDKPLG